MKESKSIAKNFIWQTCIEVTNMLLPLVTSPILSRRLGAEPLGIYTYVFTITYYFVQASLLGIYQYGAREIATVRDDNKRLNQRFSELFFFQLCHGVIVLFVFLLYSLLYSNYPLLMLINSFYVIGGSVVLINYLFAGLEEFWIISIKTMVIRIMGVVCIFSFVWTKEDLWVYTLIMALEPLAGAIVYIFLAKNRVRIIRVAIKDILKHAKGMYIVFIPIMASYIYSTMDKIMIGKLSNMTQLGFYSNAEKVLIAKNLAVALSVVMVPRMSNLISQSKDSQFDILLNKSIDVILLLTIAFGFGTAAVSRSFSIVFWGIDFESCAPLIRIMSFSLPIYGLTYIINNQLLLPKRKEHIFIVATTIGVVINLGLNYCLILKYDAVGAAISTLITQVIVLIIECILVKKDYSIITSLNNVFPYLAMGAVMYFVVTVLVEMQAYTVVNLILEILLGIFIFVLLFSIYCYLFKKSFYQDYFKYLTGVFKKNE